MPLVTSRQREKRANLQSACPWLVHQMCRESRPPDAHTAPHPPTMCRSFEPHGRKQTGARCSSLSYLSIQIPLATSPISLQNASPRRHLPHETLAHHQSSLSLPILTLPLLPPSSPCPSCHTAHRMAARAPARPRPSGSRSRSHSSQFLSSFPFFLR